MAAMIDEMDRLRETTELFALLFHYQEVAGGDRQAWQDRLQEMVGVGARELVRLHGELLAFGWIEQNTGMTPALRPGSAPACYRITTAGVRALRQVGEKVPAV
jgi:hypothetical protein